MAEIDRNELDIPFSREPLDMSKTYSEISVKSSYEYESDTKNKYTGEKDIIVINTNMSYPVTPEGAMQAAEFIKREIDAGHNIDANAAIISDSPIVQQTFLPVDKEKLEKSLAKAEKEEILSQKDISYIELYNDVASALEQFMFERGEYDYQSEEHVKWLAEANIPEDAGENEARECVLQHIRQTLGRPETIQQLISYLDSELDVMDREDENIKTADRLKMQLAAAQNSFYTNVFVSMLDTMEFTLEKKYGNTPQYALIDQQMLYYDIESSNYGTFDGKDVEGMINQLEDCLESYYYSNLEKDAENLINGDDKMPEAPKEWVEFMDKNKDFKDSHLHKYNVMDMISSHTNAVDIDKAWEQFHTPQEIELCNKEIEKNIQEHDAWKNYGDVNFAEYGGTLVRPTQHSNEYEFFHLAVDAEGDKFAFSGTIDDLHDYVNAKCVIDMAQEFDMSVEELLLYDPTRVVAELVERYGHGVLDLFPTNNVGRGMYSMDYNDFKVTDRELFAFMETVNVPHEYFPDIKNLDLSDYIHELREPYILEGNDAKQYSTNRSHSDVIQSCVEMYVALDDEALVDAIERSGAIKMMNDGPVRSLRDFDLSDFSVYLITDGWGADTHIMVSYPELEKMAEVSLSADEKLGFLTKAENTLGHSVGNWIENEVKDDNPKNVKKNEIERD